MVVPLSGVGHQRVTHPSATFTLRRIQEITFDLHALSTPLAFILSQDQTLRRKFVFRLLRNYLFKLIELKFADVSVTFQLLKSAEMSVSFIINDSLSAGNKG